jgi:hypothetical protein
MRVIVTDDLDGTEGAETVRFGMGGDMFEIDLSEDNHAKLKHALSPFIDHGRKATPAGLGPRPSVYGRFGTKAGTFR